MEDNFRSVNLIDKSQPAANSTNMLLKQNEIVTVGMGIVDMPKDKVQSK